jgi:hypothetical protein
MIGDGGLQNIRTILSLLSPPPNAALPTIRLEATTATPIDGTLVAHSDGYWYVLTKALTKPKEPPRAELRAIRDSDAGSVTIAR